MQRGGGIQSTVNATRATSEDELVNRAQWFLDRMSSMGVTTVEAKSGYGLDAETEEKMLRAIRRPADKDGQPIRIVSTFLWGRMRCLRNMPDTRMNMWISS